MRSGLGSFVWIARQLRADPAVDVSKGQQATAGPKVKHFLAMNRCIETAKRDPKFEMVFRAG